MTEGNDGGGDDGREGGCDLIVADSETSSE